MATEPPAFSQPSETGHVASVTQQHVSSSGYDPQLSNVASARAWAAAELRDHNQVEDRLVDDVELVLSELMTNAIQAGATRVSIELHAHPDWVLVSVEDDAGGQVTIRPGSPDGRGRPRFADRCGSQYSVGCGSQISWQAGMGLNGRRRLLN
jgi:hypothetical protein